MTFREKGKPPFNRKARPVFSVETKEDAENLIRLVGSLQYTEHPKIPGRQWRKINLEFKRYLDVNDIPDVTEKLLVAWQLIKGRSS